MGQGGVGVDLNATMEEVSSALRAATKEALRPLGRSNSFRRGQNADWPDFGTLSALCEDGCLSFAIR